MKYEMATEAVTDATIIQQCKKALAEYKVKNEDVEILPEGKEFDSVTLHYVYRSSVAADFVKRIFRSKAGGEPVTAPVAYSEFGLWDVPIGDDPKKFDMPFPQTCKDEECHSCGGTGHEQCEKCHGEGKHECGKCHGTKEEKCGKCKGRGEVSCSRCYGTGDMECPSCHGSGRKIDVCPVCHRGKIKKTRLVNCSRCNGTGRCISKEVVSRAYDPRGYIVHEYNCARCNGSGQVSEPYEDYCPNCHGEYRRDRGTCSRCHGTGEVTCTRCGGKKKVTCGECSGSGKVDCGHCHGSGKETCTSCHGHKDHVCTECKGKGRGIQTLHLIQSVFNKKSVRIWSDDETPECLVPTHYSKFEDQVVFSKESSKDSLDRECINPELVTAFPIIGDQWRLSAEMDYEDGKVKFSKQKVLVGKSPLLLRCIYKNDTGKHEAWVSHETGELLLLDGTIVSKAVEENVKKQENAALPTEIIIAAEEGFKLYEAGKKDNALDPLKKAAEGGHRKAISYVAMILVDKGDIKGAIPWLRKGIEKQGVRSMTIMGDLYAEGKYGSVKGDADKKKANEYYSKAAEKGFAEAMMKYGSNLRIGSGVEKDINESFKLLYEAWEKSEGWIRRRAMRQLAHMYRDGAFAEADKEKAKTLYVRAANGGDAWSLYEVGKMYFEGVTVEKNLSEARRLLELAVAKKNADANKLLGKIPKTVEIAKDCVSGITGVPGKGPLPDFVEQDYEKAVEGKLWKGKGKKSKSAKGGTSQKKRWKFVLLGIFFGILGLHFLYARRKGWFAFYWLMVIANVVHVNVSAVANLVPALAKVPIFGVLAAITFIGSIFFMKKDGNGNRM